MNNLIKLIDILAEKHSLSLQEYKKLIVCQNTEIAEYAAKKADYIRRQYYGTDIYIRGLIEVSNICHNDCYYCGIRKSNQKCQRYLLNKNQILQCCKEGYDIGFRTFVLQSGECLSVEKICAIVSEIRQQYKDCAITLSLGEYCYSDYQKMYKAGANRYLLRHETADKQHYQKLHPSEMSFDNRIQCLYHLKKIGFQVGCGFMVGSPYQTAENLAKDLKWIEQFQPDMCGIGPFMPQSETPFCHFDSGTAEQTTFLLSLIRMIKPNILLPATTALGSICPNGREQGIKAGANVIMPNLSPVSERKKYTLYDNKAITGEESAQNLAILKESMEKIGYHIVVSRGDMII